MSKIVCSVCGSDDVETQVWMKVNTMVVTDGYSLDESDDNWCCKCEEHVDLISEEEYKEQEETDEN